MNRELTNLIKIIAAVLVVGIHATANSEQRFRAAHDYFSLDFISILFNQIARFSVPIFIYFSAFGLAQSHKNDLADKSISWIAFVRNFYAKRIPSILLPYLLLSLLSLTLQKKFIFSWETLDILRYGRADYHLYFLIILLQCYLLFPFLLIAFFRAPKISAFSWIAFSTAVMLLFLKGTSDFVLGFLQIAHPGWNGAFAVYLLPYFLLGIYHANKPQEPSRLSAFWFLITILSLIWVIFEYIKDSYLFDNAMYYNHFIRISVFIYTFSFIEFLRHINASRIIQFKILSPLAGLTFGVYLWHPQILRLFEMSFPSAPTIIAWIVVVVVSFALIKSILMALQYAERRSKTNVFIKIIFFTQKICGIR